MNLVRVEKYGTRNWAVYMGGELVCVTVYKKGARRVAELVGMIELPPVQIGVCLVGAFVQDGRAAA